MTAHTLDPLEDPRWAAFVDGHPRSSIFHTKEWLRAVRQTYGYEPVVYTTSPPESEIANGVVMCGIRSWLTGRRLVSVPFADHCEFLVEQQKDVDCILSCLESSVENGLWKYVEVRPRDATHSLSVGFLPCNSYLQHTIDLRPDTNEIFASLHKDSNQRKIRRAERERLEYAEGRTDAMLAEFYRLHLLTRRRHQLPPQPISWFRNLMVSLGEKLTICAVSRDGQALGSIITLRHRDTLVYKYGASDANFHNLGTMPLIFWKLICASRGAGVKSIDLGRSNEDDEGLITFKDRLGAARSTMTYFKYSRDRVKSPTGGTGTTLIERAKPVFARMPDSMLVATGRLLYRHIG